MIKAKSNIQFIMFDYCQFKSCRVASLVSMLRNVSKKKIATRLTELNELVR